MRKGEMFSLQTGKVNKNDFALASKRIFVNMKCVKQTGKQNIYTNKFYDDKKQ